MLLEVLAINRMSICYLGVNKSSLQADASCEVPKAPRSIISHQAAL